MSKALGNMLKKCREHCDLTQKQIAVPLNIDRSTYSNYERGITEPDYDTLVKLARIFNVNPGDLIVEDSKSIRVEDVSDVPLFVLSKKEKEIITELRTMTESDKEEILHLIKKRNENK